MGKIFLAPIFALKSLTINDSFAVRILDIMGFSMNLHKQCNDR